MAAYDRERSHPRAPVRSPAQYRTPCGLQLAAYTGNISAGGAFLVAADPQVALQDPIELAMQLPGLNGPLLVRCRVVWIAESPQSPQVGLSGFGVQFLNLGQAEVRAIAATVERHLKPQA